MAACSDTGEAGKPDPNSVTERANELFKKLAHTGRVKPEPPRLVHELKNALDIDFTEQHVTAAITQTLLPEDSDFSKDAFLQFVECLLVGECKMDTEDTQRDTEHDSEDETRNLPGAASNMGPHLPEVSSAPGTRASWEFSPRVSISDLTGDVRTLAEKYYAMVEKTMVSDIDKVVDAALERYLATLPRTRAAFVTEKVREAWLKDNYVKHVSEVVEGATTATWFFKPAVSPDHLSETDKLKAETLYPQVTEATSAKINAMVASEFQKQVVATLPSHIDADAQKALHMTWLRENYVDIIDHVMKEGAGNEDAKWTFTPEIPVDMLPEAMRETAKQMYAKVDNAAAAEIEASVEKQMAPTNALLGPETPAHVKAQVRNRWLRNHYADIVSQVVEARSHWTFNPAVAVNMLPCQKQELAQQLYATVTRDTEEKIHLATEEAWKAHSSALGLDGLDIEPAVVTNIKQVWLVKEYLDIVSNNIASRKRSSEALEATPAATGTSSAMSASPVSQVVTRIAISPTPTTAPGATAEEAATPTRKIRRRRGDASTTAREKLRAEMRSWCASDMHDPRSWSEDRWNTFIGAPVSADDAPRSAAGKQVFNVVLEDDTGLICITAWNQNAHELCAIINQLEKEQQRTGTNFFLQIDVFSVTQMRGSLRDLCPIGAMQTLSASNVKRNQNNASAPRDPNMVDSSLGTQFTIIKSTDVKTPRPTLTSGSRIGIGGRAEGITNFEDLAQLHPPFRVNLAGVIAEVSELNPTTSGSGKMVRNIVLSDPNGNQVTIKQLGTGTEDTEVQKQRNVVAYFVSGTKGRTPDEPGTLWAYEDSFFKVGPVEPFFLGHKLGHVVNEISILPA